MNQHSKRHGERGSVLAIAAVSMLGLLLASGLAIDISHLYSAKAELQNAADAAAIAGASQINSTAGGIKQAVTEATKSLNLYDFGNSVTISSANLTFATNLNGTYMSQASAEGSPAGIRFVKVTLSPKPVRITLAGLVIANPQNLTATATAGLSVGLGMNKYYTAYTFIESAALPLVRGGTYTLDPKSANSKVAGSYRVLSGPGGDEVLLGTIHAYGEIGAAYTVANLVDTEMCRYARIGMNTRFGDYSVHTGSNPTDEPPDTVIAENLTYDGYEAAQATSGASGMKDRRIITLPIAMDTTYNTGSRTVVANRLAAFFVKRRVGTDCKLEVEYIGKPRAVPVGTYNPGDVQMDGLSIPVLYK